jgi:hypothetical protein
MDIGSQGIIFVILSEAKNPAFILSPLKGES